MLLETYLLLSDTGDPATRARARKAVIAADDPRAGRPRHAELLAHPVRVDPDRLADILEAERPRAIRARDVGARLLGRVPAGRAPRGPPHVVQDRLEHGRHQPPLRLYAVLAGGPELLRRQPDVPHCAVPPPPSPTQSRRNPCLARTGRCPGNPRGTQPRTLARHVGAAKRPDAPSGVRPREEEALSAHVRRNPDDHGTGSHQA